MSDGRTIKSNQGKPNPESQQEISSVCPIAGSYVSWRVINPHEIYFNFFKSHLKYKVENLKERKIMRQAARHAKIHLKSQCEIHHITSQATIAVLLLSFSLRFHIICIET